MKDVNEILVWLLGVICSILLVGWRMEKKSDKEKFKLLFEKQNASSVKLGVIENKITAIELYSINMIEEIKLQNVIIAEDITEIKVALASLPKRKKADKRRM